MNFEKVSYRYLGEGKGDNMGYKLDQIRNKCRNAIENPLEFYKYRESNNSCLVNYRGRTTDGETIDGEKPYITEVIADFLSTKDNLEKIKKMAEHVEKRSDSYNRNHDGNYYDKKGKKLKDDEVNHIKEKIVAIDLFRQSKKDGSFDYIGDVIDYQTPLKNKRADKYGEIDLLSYNLNDKKLYILELKKDKSQTKSTPETLLRCILEAYTYYKLVDIKKLLEDFELAEKDVREIVIAPLVFKNDKQYEEWKEMEKGKRCCLKKLIDNLDVKVDFFFLESKENNKYCVVK